MIFQMLLFKTSNTVQISAPPLQFAFPKLDFWFFLDL